jgi:hypothetical protein
LYSSEPTNIDPRSLTWKRWWALAAESVPATGVEPGEDPRRLLLGDDGVLDGLGLGDGGGVPVVLLGGQGELAVAGLVPPRSCHALDIRGLGLQGCAEFADT